MNSEMIQRLRETAKLCGGIKAAAVKSGVAERTLANWLAGTAEPKVLGVSAVAGAAGVSLDWLILGEEPMRRASAQLPSRAGSVGDHHLDRALPQLGQDFVMIPRYDVEASAGPGALTAEENVVDYMAFQAGWVRRVLGADPNRLALIAAKGDSMEPTIRAGDLLLVDASVNEVIDDAIYVVVMDGHLVVKRLQRFLGGAVSIKSDNAAYVEQTLSAEEIASYATIAGRVRWIGRLI